MKKEVVVTIFILLTIALSLFFVFRDSHIKLCKQSRGIDPDLANQILSNNGFQTIVDVRIPFEYNLAHYPQSISLPFDMIDKLSVNTSLNSKIAFILIYGKTESEAAKAQRMITKLGYKNVYYFAGPSNLLKM